jgi:hypothetical protein
MQGYCHIGVPSSSQRSFCKAHQRSQPAHSSCFQYCPAQSRGAHVQRMRRMVSNNAIAFVVMIGVGERPTGTRLVGTG